jgi:hypothetical protein
MTLELLAAPILPRGAVPFLLVGIAALAAVALLATGPAGKSIGRTVLVIVLGAPTAYGLGVLSRGAGELRWPIGIAFAAIGVCLALAFCAGDREEVRR